MKKKPADVVSNRDNEIALDQLPVEIKAYQDENGFALVIRSKDKRIGDAEGRLVDNFLVRILDGEAPQLHGAHPVAISEEHTQHVEVASSRIDERGRLFVTSATDGVQRPAAKQ